MFESIDSMSMLYSINKLINGKESKGTITSQLTMKMIETEHQIYNQLFIVSFIVYSVLITSVTFY